MTTVREAWARLVGLFGKGGFERELEDELKSHIELATEAYAQQGASLSEARRLAVIDLGGIEPTH